MAFMPLIMFSSLSNISHFSVNLKIQTLNIQTLQIFDNVFVHCIKFELPHKFLVVLLLYILYTDAASPSSTVTTTVIDPPLSSLPAVVVGSVAGGILYILLIIGK